MRASPAILVVRRDNIGDLVCTTPLFSALRGRFPRAWIGALVNSYNAPVLANNTDISEVVAYRKLKHLSTDGGGFAALCERLGSFWQLRRKKLDYVVLATPQFVPRTARLARLLAPRSIVGFSDDSRAARMLDLSVPISQLAGMHEVERVFCLAAHFGIPDDIPRLRVIPDPAAVARARSALGSASNTVAIHISARRPAQRWPEGHFVELIRRLHPTRTLLLWSPGASDDPRHPGDDAKAENILRQVGGESKPVAYPTHQLHDLIGALAACDRVICSDGGAMHIAAALNRPMVCLFGDSPPARWYPWGVRHALLCPPSRNVADIPVDQVINASSALT